MDIYELDRDEAIILQSGNVTRDGYDESEFEDEELHELVLTNKHLLYIVSDIDGEDEDVIKVPLSAVKVIGGKVQAKAMNHELYGRCLQIQFKHGVEYWRFGRKGKQMIPQWADALCNAILEAPMPSAAVNSQRKPASSKKGATTSGVSGFASAVKSVKDAAANVASLVRKQSEIDEDDDYTAEDNEPIVQPVHKGGFCISCGATLNAGSKFCHECGAAVGTEKPKTSKRETVYEGKLHKCPSCGEVIKSFEVCCPSCGHEFRDAVAAASVRAFAEKMEQLQKNSRRSDKDNIISHIRTFPIPNTKEDLFEFVILAGSNIREDRYDDELPKYKQEISDAWKSKFEQAYHKAKIAFMRDPAFSEIEALYRQKIGEQKNAKRKGSLSLFLSVAGIWIIVILLWGGIFLSDHIKVKSENDRLNAIVEEVYDCIEAENYVMARAKASTLVFAGSTFMADGDAATEKWEITRTELLAIIDKAEYGADYVAPNANNGTTSAKTESIQFAYLNSEWDLYIAIEHENGLIKIEKWRKGNSSDLKFDYDYDLGLFNINDAECAFSWIDDEKMAFTITLKDSKNMRLMKETPVVFIANNDGSKFTGSHYSDDIARYSFQNDDWHLYRAMLINETSVKIEVWDRGSSDSAFEYERDLCVINLNDSLYNLQWSSEAHTAFSITLKDSKNLYWGKEKRIVFALENEDYSSKDLFTYFYGEN